MSYAQSWGQEAISSTEHEDWKQGDPLLPPPPPLYKLNIQYTVCLLHTSKRILETPYNNWGQAPN